MKNKIIKAILARASKHHHCENEYERAQEAKTLKEFYEVIVDNIVWCMENEIITAWRHFLKYAPQNRVRIIKKEGKDFYWKLIRWYENGKKKCEINYRNGKLHGKWMYLFRNGQKEWEVNYKNGKLHGKLTWWYKNGNKKWEENYKNGELHGKQIEWDEARQIILEENWENGKLKEIQCAP